jgi:hypothetical protein
LLGILPALSPFLFSGGGVPHAPLSPDPRPAMLHQRLYGLRLVWPPEKSIRPAAAFLVPSFSFSVESYWGLKSRKLAVGNLKSDMHLLTENFQLFAFSFPLFS